MIYRVKQISKYQYIPQCRKRFSRKWLGISHYGDRLLSFDSSSSIVDTIEYAKEIINKHREYPKYYKV